MSAASLYNLIDERADYLLGQGYSGGEVLAALVAEFPATDRQALAERVIAAVIARTS